MGKVLFLFTDKYPFGSGETFIEAERKQWTIFEKVYICPVLVQPGETLREGFVCAHNECLIQTHEQVVSPVSIMRGITGSIQMKRLFKELVDVRNITKTRKALAVTILTNLRFKRLYSVLKGTICNIDSNQILLYSYWMFEPALVAVGFKKIFRNARFITRAHGYDLYEDRQPGSYAPFRSLILEKVDAIYSISENGYRYLKDKYPGACCGKLSVERLGTEKLFSSKENLPTEKVRLVSCSNIIPLKRIDRIIEALKEFKCEIEWCHFGDGELMNELKHQAEHLPKNVIARFMGRVPNSEVQRFYSEYHIDAFINVSETEGIPVSIMEAFSYGIPVVATSVGGTSELVRNGENGILLEKEFKNDDLYEAINNVLHNQELYRAAARNTWREKCDANSIYSKFYHREYELI